MGTHSDPPDPPVPPIIARPPGDTSHAETDRSDQRRHELGAHLDAVREYALETLPEEDTPLATVVEVAAYLHDFGKLTAYFQQYIHDRARDRRSSVSRQRRSHAFLGAFATHHVLREYGLSEDWQAVGVLAVAKHHAGHLPDMRAVREYMGTNDFGPFAGQTTVDQVESILECAPLRRAAGEHLAAARPDDIEPDQAFRAFLEDFHTRETLMTLDRYRVSSDDTDQYARLLRVWSTITRADKLDSAGLSPRSPSPFDPDAVQQHIDDELSTGDSESEPVLNERRNDARTTALDRVSEFLAADTPVGRITLPTGFGKTLTGTQVAHEIADRTGGRVVYALPYTSIIDQTDAVLREVFGVSPLDEEYTIHHYLADTRTRSTETADGDALPFGDQRLLARTWQADLILTTFVQLFESLVSPTNRQSVKLPSLQDAVVVVDEPQAISHDWWRLITRLCRLLSREYDAHVVFMTATQPKLFERDDDLPDPFEFVPDGDPYYGLIDADPRVEFHLHPSVLDYLEAPGRTDGIDTATAAETIVDGGIDGHNLGADDTGAAGAPGTTDVASADDVDDTDSTDGPDAGRSTLAVCNTVASATALGDHLLRTVPEATNLNRVLKEHLAAGPLHELAHDHVVDALVGAVAGGAVVATLTTRLRPIDRKLLLVAIRRLVADATTTLYVASTQLVEAGVDLSFDRLFRDLAPVPSLVQAAGRCNREFGADARPVVVWRLGPPEGGSSIPSDVIYADHYDLLTPTREALDSHRGSGVVSEATMIDTVVDQYYKHLHELAAPGDPDLVEDLRRGRFDALASASLIGDDYPTADVVVCTDRRDHQLVELYRAALDGDHYELVRTLQRHLASRTVSVPLRDAALSGAALTQITEDHYYALDALGSPDRYALESAGGIRGVATAADTSF